MERGAGSSRIEEIARDVSQEERARPGVVTESEHPERAVCSDRKLEPPVLS